MAECVAEAISKCTGEPRRSHDHRLAALPVDFAFLDVFVFEVVEQAAREQRDEDGREPVWLLVPKAIIAGHVAFRGRKYCSRFLHGFLIVGSNGSVHTVIDVKPDNI
jgi:hypothetical protein